MKELEGLKGLTTQDRDTWEKEYSKQLSGKSPEQIERFYRNVKFKEKFGDREDYNILKGYSPEQRDSLYNDAYQIENVAQNLKERNSMTLGQIQEQHYQDLSKQQHLDAENESKINSIIEDSPSYKTDEGWESYNANKKLQDFDSFADTVSPYYKAFKDTEYLPLSREDKYNLLLKFDADKQILGEEEATNRFRNKIQDIASENQSVGEKYWNGFKGMGNSVAGSLIGFAGIARGMAGALGEEDINYIIDNPWTRYGNDVVQYGSMYPELIAKAKSTGISNIPVIRTAEEEQKGILENLWSVNTIPELINQIGFTITSMGIGTGLSAVSKYVFSGLKGATMAAKSAGIIKNLETTKKALSVLQKAQQRTNAFIIPGMVGTNEGVINALQTKQNVLESYKQELAKLQNQRVEEEVKRLIKDVGPEELNKQGYNLQDPESVQKLYQDVFNSQAKDYEDDLNKREENANKAMWINFGLNSFINGAMNSTLKAGIQTSSVQEALRRSKLGKIIPTGKYKVNTQGNVTSKLNKPSKIVNVLQEPAGEFTEEYLQSVSDAFAQGGAEYNLTNYINQKYNKEGEGVVNESITNDLIGALKFAGESLTDKETILSGIYGALSSGIGTLNINNRRGPSTKMKEESKLGYAYRRSPLVYRNPIYEAIKEQKAIGEERNETAKILTDWIQDPDNKAKYDGIIGTFNWAKSMEDASQVGDEFAYRNSAIGKMINDAFMLDKLKGTAYHNSFLQDVLRAANAEEGSQEAQSLIEQFKNNPSNKESNQEDATILTTIKKNANSILNTLSEIQTESDNIDKMLGNAANQDTKQALIYGKLTMEDNKKRLKSLTEELSQVEINSSIDNSPLSPTQKELLVKYGSNKAVEAEKENLQNKINDLTKDIANIKNRKNLGVKEQSTLKSKQTTKRTLLKELKKIQSIENSNIDGTLNESDIMSLPASIRGIILNKENRGNYSEEQQAIIDNVLSQGTFSYSDFSNKIQDAAKLENANNAYLTQYNSILTDPSAMNAYANKIKQQVHKDNIIKKYEHLNNITDYPTFRKDLDKAFQDSSIEERIMISDILKDNSNFNRFKQDNKVLEGLFDQLELNENFNNLDTNNKHLLMTAMQYLTNEGVNPSNINDAVQTLSLDSGKDLKKYVEEINIRLSEKMDISNLGEIIQNYKDLLGIHEKNEQINESINTPITPTTTDPQESAPTNPGIFGSDAIFSTPEGDQTKDYEQPKEEISEEKNSNDIVGKFIDNSNEEISKSISTILNYIDKGSNSELYAEVREAARDIINDLGDSEYEDLDTLKESILTKANQVRLNSLEGGDFNDRLASLLLSSISKVQPVISDNLNTKEEKKEEKEEVQNDIVNNNFIRTAPVYYYPNSSVGKAYSNYKIDEYLRSNKLTNKTPIMFMADPALTSSVKEEMGDKYSEENNLPILAVVEDPEGPITIEDKQYQPIGFMPSTNNTKASGAARTKPIRQAAISQQDGTLLKEGNKIITTTSRQGVVASSPQHTKQGTPNTSIQQIMLNDMEGEQKELLSNSQTSVEERKSIYNKVRDSILKNIRKVTSTNNEKKIHLSYITPNLKGGTTEFQIYITPIENTYSRTQKNKTILEVLRNGTSKEILRANSRINRFGKSLNSIFKGNPFKDDFTLKIYKGTIIPTGETTSKINNLQDKLTNTLGNFITIPKSYSYKITPTEKVIGENRIYEIQVTDGSISIPLAEISNGEVAEDIQAQVIKNLLLDTDNLRKDKGQPFAKWQVNYNDFNISDSDTEEIKKYKLNNTRDIFDDNILEASRESFKYNIIGVDINSPFKMDKQVTHSTVISNPTNASSVSIDSPTIISNDQIITTEGVIDSESGAILDNSIKKEETSILKKENTDYSESKKLVGAPETFTSSIAKPKHRFARKKKEGANLKESAWDGITDSSFKEALLSLQINKEKWDAMSESERDHEKECLGF